MRELCHLLLNVAHGWDESYERKDQTRIFPLNVTQQMHHHESRLMEDEKNKNKNTPENQHEMAKISFHSLNVKTLPSYSYLKAFN